MSAISSPTRPSVASTPATTSNQPAQRTNSRSTDQTGSMNSSVLTTEQQVKFLQLAAEIESLLVAVQAKKQQQSQTSLEQ